ncbi:MAG: exodeoxyribonuclease VII large subunit, partial [Oscillospiraceae bacterium]|nr:exodeoxyribonuclease VII large subunit [Oscillospiraceae bacterium]
MNGQVYSVSELNGRVKDLLDSDAVLRDVFVMGELSNYKLYPSGHHYFSMKDAEGTLRCVMFRGQGSKLVFKPENGMQVVANGRVSVFPRDGAYQLYVNQLIPHGVGDLHLAYEQLKEKLSKEGLFDPAHKKPIPKFPGKIALITSGAGAAVRDMIRVLGLRYPLSKVIVMPVRVQGVEAPPEIVGALNYANRHAVADLIITGRGGGSIEDLWAFNDEGVARAIFASEIPVISAVGHEPDVTIADFVADLRAATPSNAAELAVPHIDELREILDNNSARMAAVIRRQLHQYRERLSDFRGKPVLESPLSYIGQRRQAYEHMRA